MVSFLRRLNLQQRAALGALSLLAFVLAALFVLGPLPVSSLAERPNDYSGFRLAWSPAANRWGGPLFMRERVAARPKKKSHHHRRLRMVTRVDGLAANNRPPLLLGRPATAASRPVPAPLPHRHRAASTHSAGPGRAVEKPKPKPPAPAPDPCQSGGIGPESCAQAEDPGPSGLNGVL
jgi:hypothetical protein